MPKKPVQIILIGIWLVIHFYAQISQLMTLIENQNSEYSILNILLGIFYIAFIIYIIQFFRFKPFTINIALVYFILASTLGAFLSISRMIQLQNPKLIILLLVGLTPNILSILFLIKKDTKDSAKQFDLERANIKKLHT